MINAQASERHAAQLGLKYALAAGVKIVAVDQGEGRGIGYNMRIERVTTPQISKVRSSVMVIAAKLEFSSARMMAAPRRR